MKRRTFIRRTTLGLSALATSSLTGGVLGGSDEGDRLYGTPASVNPSDGVERNLLRMELSQTEIPVEVWDEIVAASLLAREVFSEPEIARAFREDPQGFLKSRGMHDVVLPPETVEVKVALALGDPQLREAAKNQDAQAFLEGLEQLEILRAPEASLLADKISSQLARFQATPQGASLTPEVCTLTAICLAVVWIWVTVVQDVLAAVTAAALVMVYVAALVLVETIGPRKRTAVEMLRNHPSLGLAQALGGPPFGSRVADTFIETNVERAAAAVEGLPVYREHQPMTPDELRGMIRRRLLRSLAQGGGPQGGGGS